MLLIILTGLIMSYGWANNLLFRVTGNEPPPVRQREERGPPKPRSIPNLNGLDALLIQAQQSNPGWRSISLLMPQSPEAPVPLMVDRGGRGQPHLRTMLNLDLAKQQISRSKDDFSQQNLGRRLRMYARFLHTGELFGLLGQTIAAVCTLSAILLVWTGFALAWRRFFRRKSAV